MNAADESAIELRIKERELAARREIDDFMWMMDDARGRRLMWQMIGDCGVFNSTFSVDAGIMAFQEGRRDVGLKLLAKINDICPHAYAMMAAENQQRGEDYDS